MVTSETYINKKPLHQYVVDEINDIKKQLKEINDQVDVLFHRGNCEWGPSIEHTMPELHITSSNGKDK